MQTNCVSFLLIAATVFVSLEPWTPADAYQFRSQTCKSLYVKRWKVGSPHKAIAAMRTAAKEVCGFSDDWVSLEEAKTIALKECRKQALKFKVNPKGCKIVEFK